MWPKSQNEIHCFLQHVEDHYSRRQWNMIKITLKFLKWCFNRFYFNSICLIHILKSYLSYILRLVAIYKSEILQKLFLKFYGLLILGVFSRYFCMFNWMKYTIIIKIFAGIRFSRARYIRPPCHFISGQLSAHLMLSAECRPHSFYKKIIPYTCV